MTEKEKENLSCDEKGALFALRTVKKINAEDDFELRQKLEGAFNRSCKSEISKDEDGIEEEE
jgi:hypothetical protein